MSKRKHIVIFSGAGISAESGISTFRDNGGLWDKYDVKEVATPDAWRNNPQLVLEFYNERRKQVLEASPNAAHKAIVELEKKFDVTVITQNVDDLHERAGSKKVVHLHGEIRKSRSTYDPKLIYNIKGWELNPGDRCEHGSQLRPHIVWFGEMVPEMTRAQEITASADVLITVGTSLNVYPAAGLVHAAPKGSKLFVIDPNDVPLEGLSDVKFYKDKAGNALPEIVKALLDSAD
jgi:NAD-dependent deacetylase